MKTIQDQVYAIAKEPGVAETPVRESISEGDVMAQDDLTEAAIVEEELRKRGG